MKARRAFVLVLIAALTGAAAPAIGRHASAAAVVTVDVLVLDEAGQPLDGLSRDDIEVRSNGTAVPVVSFSPAPQELSIVLIVDASMSQPLKRYEIQNALTVSWLPSLIPGDRARVATLGRQTALGPWLSTDRASEAAAVRAMVGRAESETSPIWDAVEMAVQALASASGSKVVLLLTDGRATGNRIGLEDAMRAAQDAGVSVSTVSEGSERLLPQGADAAARVRSDTSLRMLADATGGLFLPDGVARRTLRPQDGPFAWARELSQTPNRPGPLLAQVMSTLRRRYRLRFEASADRQPHTLEVRARTSGALVRAPQRFVAKSP